MGKRPPQGVSCLVEDWGEGGGHYRIPRKKALPKYGQHWKDCTRALPGKLYDLGLEALESHRTDPSKSVCLPPSRLGLGCRTSSSLFRHL